MVNNYYQDNCDFSYQVKIFSVSLNLLQTTNLNILKTLKRKHPIENIKYFQCCIKKSTWSRMIQKIIFPFIKKYKLGMDDLNNSSYIRLGPPLVNFIKLQCSPPWKFHHKCKTKEPTKTMKYVGFSKIWCSGSVRLWTRQPGVAN